MSDWDIIVNSERKTRRFFLPAGRARLLAWGAGAAGFLLLAGVGSLVALGFVLTDNARLRAQNAEFRKKQSIVEDLQAELAEMKQLRENLQYMLGAEGEYVPKTAEPGALSPEVGLKSENTVPEGMPLPGPITQGFSKDHPGIDIAAETGSPVAATAMGKVERVRQDDILGLVVYIKHPGGYTTIYGHLSKALVEEGSVVYGGDIVGLVGQTGVVTGPHLHYAVMKGSEFVNPSAQEGGQE